MAHAKNKSVVKAFFAGLFFGMFALIYYIFAKSEPEETRKGFICSNCGAEVPEDAEYCPKCGAKFEGFKKEGEKRNKKQKSKNIISRLIRLVIALFLAAVIVNVIVGFFHGIFLTGIEDLGINSSNKKVMQSSEEEYNKNAIDINKKISKGNFEVIVTKAGFFEPEDWIGKKQYLRVDLEIKNIGNQSEYFSPEGIVIIDDQKNQYERTFGGTIDGFSKIYPGVTKKGYVLFEGVPKTANSLKFVFELGYNKNLEPYLFEYEIPLK